MMYAVIRTQVLFDRETHEALKRAAAVRRIGLSALVRELVRHALGGSAPGRRRRRFGWTFVGAIRGDRANVSERHDEILAHGKRW
jgi:hypothetical protein